MHAYAVKQLNYWLITTFQPDFEVRSQTPFEAFDESVPEPDGAVYTSEQDARWPHPNSALLLIEISDSSLELDREKAFEYAASGVEEYWIINVNARNAEVFTEPVVDASSVTGFRYASHRIVDEFQSVTPVFKALASLDLSRLMLLGR